MDECLGSAVGAMGAEYVLKILPLDLDSKKYIEIIEEEYEENNLWLIPILKKYIVGDRLSVFTESILPIIKATQHKSEMLKQQGKNVDEFVYSLWSLLPSFCNYPLDTSKSFKDVEKALRDTLGEDMEGSTDPKKKEIAGVQMIICSSLQILIKQNKNILQGNHDDDDVKSAAEKRAIAQYNPEIASQNLSVFKSFAPQLLSHLCGGVLLNCSKYTLLKDNIGHVQSTIVEVASISDKDEIEESLKSVIEKLLLLNKKSEKEYPVWKYLADLAVSILLGVDAENIDLFFQEVIKPALKDNKLPIQKKAYKVLSIILQKFEEFNVRNLKELHELMIESKSSCQISAKCARLDCLYYLIISKVQYKSEEKMHHMITCFVNEIIVALKEVNMKIRDRAYNLLVKIGHADKPEKSGMLQFLSMVVGNIPDINSSAEVKGLGGFPYDFTELVSEGYNFRDPSTFLILEEKKRKIIKANLGLIKVFVGNSEAETLQTHLKSMVESLVNWEDSTEESYLKIKIKMVFEMLVKKCGMDAVKSVMPEDHMNLLEKLEEKNERKVGARNFEEARAELSKADKISSRAFLITTTLDQLDDKLKTRSALLQLKRRHDSDDELEFDSQDERFSDKDFVHTNSTWFARSRKNQKSA